VPRVAAARLPETWKRLAQEQHRTLLAAERRRRTVAESGPLDPLASARAAGLRYVDTRLVPGIVRCGSPRQFKYRGANKRWLRNRDDLARIRALAIPPAWTDVWICPNPEGHVQATGRDARGRKQYRYHPRWRDVRDEVKYGRLLAFAAALPKVRSRTAADLKRQGLPRAKVLAAIVQLLEKTLIRVGNDEYARQNGSVGLTTMRDANAKVMGERVRFEFRGKSGLSHAIDLSDRRLARIVKRCRDLPGYELFQYCDADGVRQCVDSSDVNAYLRETTGADFTAKDFRTWAGTVLAAEALAAQARFKSAAEAKRNVVAAIASVACRLGNTKAVCRKSYIHPAVIDAYLDGATIQRPALEAAAGAGLTGVESAVVRLLAKGLGRKKQARLSRPAA
jgi:DNA topoisomerase-1